MADAFSAKSEVLSLYGFDIAVAGARECCVVGTDEAGRGPLAGPVVAAAVGLDLTEPIEGIRDSKKVRAAERERLYSAITRKAICWAVGMAGPEEIDECNILRASLRAMKRALDGLLVPWDLVLVDGNRPIDDLPCARQQTVVRGDTQSASVAAASIIAKVTRDRMMQQYDQQYPDYGFAVHKGYPTQFHREQVRRYGLCDIHRRSFCEKILARAPTLPL